MQAAQHPGERAAAASLVQRSLLATHARASVCAGPFPHWWPALHVLVATLSVAGNICELADHRHYAAAQGFGTECVRGTIAVAWLLLIAHAMPAVLAVQRWRAPPEATLAHGGGLVSAQCVALFAKAFQPRGARGSSRGGPAAKNQRVGATPRRKGKAAVPVAESSEAGASQAHVGGSTSAAAGPGQGSMAPALHLPEGADGALSQETELSVLLPPAMPASSSARSSAGVMGALQSRCGGSDLRRIFILLAALRARL